MSIPSGGAPWGRGGGRGSFVCTAAAAWAREEGEPARAAPVEAFLLRLGATQKGTPACMLLGAIGLGAWWK